MRNCNRRNLLIVGMGQYGMVAKEIAESMGYYNEIDFVDDTNPAAVGKMSDIGNLVSAYDSAVVAIGNYEIRLKCIALLSKYFHIATLIHPSSYISPSAIIERGCIIEPLAVIHTDVHLSEGCLISAGAVVNHNSILQRGCHVDCNAVISARSKVPTGTKVSMGSVYLGSAE